MKFSMSRFYITILLCTLLTAFTGIFSPAHPNEHEPLEIEIETTVRGTPLERFMVTTTVISRDEIEKSPAGDLPGLLRGQTGVISMGVANKKGKADLGIRGFGLNYIRVYLDGVPLNTANDRTVDLSLIPLEVIEKVQVIKGPAPVTYGSDAMGGIINIITRSGRDLSGTWAKVSGGSFGAWQGSFLAGGNSGRFSFFAAGKIHGHDGYRPNTRENFTDLFIKTDCDFAPGQRSSLMIFNTTGNRQAPDGINQDGTIRPQASGFLTGSYNWRYSDIIQQGLNLKIGTREDSPERGGYQASFYYRRYDDTLKAMVDPGTATTPPSGSPFAYYQPGRWNYSYWESNIYGGDLRFMVPAVNHRLTLGGAFERSSFRDTYMGRANPQDPPGSMGLPKHQWDRDYMAPWTRLDYSSLYLQDEIRLNRELNLTLGIRSDSFEKSKPSINGIVNLVYEKDNNTWRATLGKTGRFPSLKELEGRGGNPNLVAESAVNCELGYRHREENLVDLETALAYSTIRNLITPGDPTSLYSPKENIGLVKLLSWEAGITRQWDRLRGRMGYTYLNRVSPVLTGEWEEIPRHKYIAQLEWEKEKSLCWAVQGIFYSNRKTGDPDIPRIPGYGIVNVRLAYPNLTGQPVEGFPLGIELKVDNILNKEYQNRLYYPAPGRWITGTVTYRF